MLHFGSIDPLPEMPKYRILEQFIEDPRPDKLLLSSGAFKNERAETPLFESVRLATARVQQRGLPRDYLDIAGYQPFVDAMERLIFGDTHDVLTHNRIQTAHTPGGTAALRIAAELLRSVRPDAAVWVSDPTWGNHVKVFEAAGLSVGRYAYYNAGARALDFAKMLDSLRRIPERDAVFFQAATHNPTCIDPTVEQWRELAHVVQGRELLPVFDVAFFGFQSGIREDLEGMLSFCGPGRELVIATSQSKSFAMYNERVGTLSIVAATAEDAARTFSHVRHLIRASYSNPPLHGAAIIAEILTDPELFATWKKDLQQVRDRMRHCRELLVERLRARGVERDLSYVLRERGMFTQIALTEEQLQELRVRDAIHLSRDGRLNLTALTDRQMERFCDVLARYLI